MTLTKSTPGNDSSWQELVKSPVFRRSLVLFFNFFLIILAYYQVKGASRTLLLEHWGSKSLPQVWIYSAITLTLFIGTYHSFVQRYSRLRVVLGSCLLFIALLIVFWGLFGAGIALAAVGFYIFIDIFSVILVEQFWSLTNTITDKEAGKQSYWFIGTGGIVGGALGGALAGSLIGRTGMTTPDLLLSGAVLLSLIFLLNLAMAWKGFYVEVQKPEQEHRDSGDWRELIRDRYILLIAALLLCAQMAQPVVEYQFLASIEAAFETTDERTQYISYFFFWLGIIAGLVNVLFASWIHKYMGVFAGLLVQPIVLTVSSFAFMTQSTLFLASAMKVGDRGLSYSINRASKEQLYIPLGPVQTYQAKAWIDMLGYRLFKVVSSAILLVIVPFLTLAQVSWLTLGICTVWFIVIALLAREYHSYTALPAPAE